LFPIVKKEAGFMDSRPAIDWEKEKILEAD